MVVSHVRSELSIVINLLKNENAMVKGCVPRSCDYSAAVLSFCWCVCVCVCVCVGVCLGCFETF